MVLQPKFQALQRNTRTVAKHQNRTNCSCTTYVCTKHYRFAHQLTIIDTVRGTRACMLMTMRYFDGQCVCTTTYVSAKVSAAAKSYNTTVYSSAQALLTVCVSLVLILVCMPPC
jgi:hypothetical protein